MLLDEQAADAEPTFARFTAAEELGHLVLHRAVMQTVRSLDDVVELHKSPGYYGTLDRNAKRFAASVLMPAERLRSDAAAEYAALFAAKTDRAMLPGKLLFRLSQQYRVSAIPMRFRLTEYPVCVTAAVERSLKAGSPQLLLSKVRC